MDRLAWRSNDLSVSSRLELRMGQPAFMTRIEYSLRTQQWWVKTMTRRKADRWLLDQPQIRHGAESE